MENKSANSDIGSKWINIHIRVRKHACTESALFACLQLPQCMLTLRWTTQTILHGALNTHLFNKLRELLQRSLYLSGAIERAFCKRSSLPGLHTLHRGCILACWNCSQQSHYRCDAGAHLCPPDSQESRRIRRRAKHAQSNGAAVKHAAHIHGYTMWHSMVQAVLLYYGETLTGWMQKCY